MAILSQYQQATINSGVTYLTIPASGSTAATPFDCQGAPPLGFVTPTNWVACSITFAALPYLLPFVVYAASYPANDQLATIYDESDSATTYIITTGTGYGFYRLPPTLFNGVRYLNFQTSVSQTTAANVNLILTPLWQGIHN